MARKKDTENRLGARIMRFRKEHELTQSDLANRYKVSGPAIFKFEKGFVTPSLKLWQTIAADMGIPEREAVLVWAREKLPERMHGLVQEEVRVDLSGLCERLTLAEAEGKGCEALRTLLLEDHDLSPAVKKFATHPRFWKIIQPTARELVFVIELDEQRPRMRPDQIRDALLLAREIAAGD